MAVDFMGVMRKCAKCRSDDDIVCWSDAYYCYICDSCYSDISDEKLDDKECTSASS